MSNKWVHLTAQTPDKYGRTWTLQMYERCTTCGQPDNMSECNHTKLPVDQVIELGGTPARSRSTQFPCPKCNVGAGRGCVSVGANGRSSHIKGWHEERIRDI